MDSESSEYLKFSVIAALLIGVLPLMFRTYRLHVLNKDIKFADAAFQVSELIVISSLKIRYSVMKHTHCL